MKPKRATAKSNSQFKEIFQDKRIYNSLIKVVNNSHLYNCPRAQNLFFSTLNQLQDSPDNIIYDQLYHLFQEQISNSQEYRLVYPRGFELNESRANGRALQIKNLIPTDFQINSLLDIGCSEGSITSAMARLFQLPANQVIGCDIKSSKSLYHNFDFIQLKNNNIPLQSNSISLTTAIMSLHHIEKVSSMIREIHRVLEVGALFIFREHDCQYSKVRTLLDVIHGLYAMVWQKDREMTDFRTYFARYRSQEEWSNLITKIGFRKLEEEKPGGPLRAYLAVYQKI